MEYGEVEKKLSALFDASEVKFKPAAVSGNRALALAYVDARVIQDRLDEVLGVAGWQDEYECLPDGSVVCRLRLRLGEEWITKMDVGGQSDQPDAGDRRKAAFSDALKRAAVKFGIGRYLYRLPAMWVDYDPRKRQFVRPPVLPASATRRKDAAPAGPSKAPPQNGKELWDRLKTYEAKLVAKGLCALGELMAHIAVKGVQLGHPANLRLWTGEIIDSAVREAEAFGTDRQNGCRAAKPVPGSDAAVSEEQETELRAILKLIDRDEVEFLNWFGKERAERAGRDIEVLGDLTLEEYEIAKRDLLQFRKRKLAAEYKKGDRANREQVNHASAEVVE